MLEIAAQPPAPPHLSCTKGSSTSARLAAASARPAGRLSPASAATGCCPAPPQASSAACRALLSCSSKRRTTCSAFGSQPCARAVSLPPACPPAAALGCWPVRRRRLLLPAGPAGAASGVAGWSSTISDQRLAWKAPGAEGGSDAASCRVGLAGGCISCRVDGGHAATPAQRHTPRQPRNAPCRPTRPCPPCGLSCLQRAAQQRRHLVHHSAEVAPHQLLGPLQQRLLKQQRPQWRGAAQHPLADVGPGHGGRRRLRGGGRQRGGERRVGGSVCAGRPAWAAVGGTVGCYERGG